MDGYVRIYRKIFDDGIWDLLKPEGRCVLIAILKGCNYQKSYAVFDGKKITINPGEWLASIETIRKHAGSGISARNVRTALDRLESGGFLSYNRQSNNARIIVINKEYLPDEETEPTKNRQRTDKEPTKNRHYPNKEEGIKNKELKEIYKEKSETIFLHYKNKIRGEGGTAAREKIFKILSTGAATPETLIRCIDHYCVSNGASEPRYMKQAPTFFGPSKHWMDYIDSPVMVDDEKYDPDLPWENPILNPEGLSKTEWLKENPSWETSAT